MNDGRAAINADQLRALVREVLAEVVGRAGEQRRDHSGHGVGAADAVGPGIDRIMPGQSGDRPPAWTVRISSDDDLHAFALRVLKLADNPKLRRDLIGGRIRFALAGAATAGPSAAHRVDKGAVTERTVAAAAKAGARLVLGPRAVLTPLARDKARALGVPIEKER